MFIKLFQNIFWKMLPKILGSAKRSESLSAETLLYFSLWVSMVGFRKADKFVQGHIIG
jgi:hypothetical protein